MKIFPNSVLLCFLICVLALPTASSFGVELKPAIRAPVLCDNAPSCGSAISLSEARASLKKGEKLLPQKNREPLPPGLLGPVRPKVKPMIDGHICDSADVLGLYYFWAPMERLPGGRQAFDDMIERLQSGHPFESKVYVEASHSRPHEHHIALCPVRTIHGRTGPAHELHNGGHNYSIRRFAPSRCRTKFLLSCRQYPSLRRYFNRIRGRDGPRPGRTCTLNPRGSRG